MRNLSLFIAIAFASTSADAANIFLYSGRGKDVYVGQISDDTPIFYQLVNGNGGTFTLNASGLIGTDPRNYDPIRCNYDPNFCNSYNYISFSQTFTATEDPQNGSIRGPFFGGNTMNFLFSFTSTSGGDVIASVPGSALPEPASWAMMICGFGTIGRTLRSQRKTQITFA